MNGIEGKLDTPIRAVQDAGIDQGGDIAVHGLDITPDASGCFADGNHAGTAQGAQQLPPFGREHLPEQFRGCKADAS